MVNPPYLLFSKIFNPPVLQCPAKAGVVQTMKPSLAFRQSEFSKIPTLPFSTFLREPEKSITILNTQDEKNNQTMKKLKCTMRFQQIFQNSNRES